MYDQRKLIFNRGLFSPGNQFFFKKEALHFTHNKEINYPVERYLTYIQRTKILTRNRYNYIINQENI